MIPIQSFIFNKPLKDFLLHNLSSQCSHLYLYSFSNIWNSYFIISNLHTLFTAFINNYFCATCAVRIKSDWLIELLVLSRVATPGCANFHCVRPPQLVRRNLDSQAPKGQWKTQRFSRHFCTKRVEICTDMWEVITHRWYIILTRCKTGIRLQDGFIICLLYIICTIFLTTVS